MIHVNLRAFVVVLCMLSAVFLAYFLKPNKYLADQQNKLILEDAFPRAFGEWTVDDSMNVIVPSPDVESILNKIYNQVVSRTYVNGKGQRVMLSVAYGGDQSDGTRAHRPEVCYPAQGFQIIGSSTSVYKLSEYQLRVKRLVAKLGGRVEPISYWVTVGEEVALTGLEQKLAQLRYGVKGLIPDGMLMRVSTIGEGGEESYRLHQAFIADLYGSTDSSVRWRIFGRLTPNQ